MHPMTLSLGASWHVHLEASMRPSYIKTRAGRRRLLSFASFIFVFGFSRDMLTENFWETVGSCRDMYKDVSITL